MSAREHLAAHRSEVIGQLVDWVRIPSVDRLLSSAVSIVPIQLLAWRLANARGRVPGAYTRASKVTTRE